MFFASFISNKYSRFAFRLDCLITLWIYSLFIFFPHKSSLKAKYELQQRLFDLFSTSGTQHSPRMVYRQLLKLLREEVVDRTTQIFWSKKVAKLQGIWKVKAITSWTTKSYLIHSLEHLQIRNLNSTQIFWTNLDKTQLDLVQQPNKKRGTEYFWAGATISANTYRVTCNLCFVPTKLIFFNTRTPCRRCVSHHRRQCIKVADPLSCAPTQLAWWHSSSLLMSYKTNSWGMTFDHGRVGARRSQRW